jgi:hypothetical protein
MYVTVSCECGAAAAQVVVGEGSALNATCHDCGRPLKVSGGSADHVDDSPGFTLMPEETVPRPTVQEPERELGVLLRQLDALSMNTVRSVQALEGKLTVEESTQILVTIEGTKEARRMALDSAVVSLRAALGRLDKAAALIGQAMLRP